VKTSARRAFCGDYTPSKFNIFAIITIIAMPTTISVTDDVKEALLRVASELQLKLGRRVDLNEAIRYLLIRKKRPDLLEEACRPVPGFEGAYRELLEGRKKDEERAHGKYGV